MLLNQVMGLQNSVGSLLFSTANHAPWFLTAKSRTSISEDPTAGARNQLLGLCGGERFLKMGFFIS